MEEDNQSSQGPNFINEENHEQKDRIFLGMYNISGIS